MLRSILPVLSLAALILSPTARADDLSSAIQSDYDAYLGELFDHFHRNPELSHMEHATAARLAEEFRESGYEVTEGVGGTGVVASPWPPSSCTTSTRAAPIPAVSKRRARAPWSQWASRTRDWVLGV